MQPLVFLQALPDIPGIHPWRLQVAQDSLAYMHIATAALASFLVAMAAPASFLVAIAAPAPFLVAMAAPACIPLECLIMKHS